MVPALPLSDLAVWVIDCQTTGASPAHGAVLEIGETAAGGLSVTVRLPGNPESDDSTVPDITHEKVTA